MSDFAIRVGHLKDVLPVMDLVQACCRALWPTMDDRLIDAHRRLLELSLRCHHRQLLVAQSQGTIVAALVADKLGSCGPEFSFVVVEPGHRRQGLGRTLFGRAAHWLGHYPASRLFVPDQCPQLSTFSRQLGLEPFGDTGNRLSVSGQFYLLLPGRAKQLAKTRPPLTRSATDRVH